jgi:hypothetical protein
LQEDRAVSTASRRLETLSLLQSHPGISATSLGDRLGVTERTVRYLNLDIDVIEPSSLNDRLGALGRWLLDRHAVD